ncbi:MAG: peptide MFS transporter [Deltaproteobacteria bacterium]|nr:peptide MFS transporter [Deltaproteobacteria bacterium]
MSSVALAGNGHPKGLYLLFFVEMWECFSYYGMRALLVLYMTKELMFSTEKAGTVYGWYTGLVYLTPLLGGYIADRYLGARKSILVGGTLMALGHFSMAFSSMFFFYAALTLLIFGNGFFKPNISTTVGKLYGKDDPRRDGGFTIFYMGINLGAFFSPLVCGTLGERVGWHFGFAAAGVGMVAGLLLYLWGQKRYLGDAGLHPEYQPTKDHHQTPLTTEEKHRVAVIFILVFFVLFFWMSFEQAGSSLTLFAEHSTDRMIPLLGWEFPTSWFQSVNPFLIFVMAPLFSMVWVRMAKANIEPSTPMKMAWGLAFLAISFVIMVFAGLIVDKTMGRVGLLWLLGSYFFATVGELCLSPIGLSLVTKLSPARFGSLLMGTWFVSSFLANLVGGLLAGNYDAMNKATFFMIPVATSGGAALLLFLLVKPLRKWMHGVH